MDTTEISLVMRVDAQKLHLNVDVCVISGKTQTLTVYLHSYSKTYLSTFCSWNEHTTQSVLLRNSVSAVAFGPKITKQKSLRNDFPQCTHTDKKHEALCLFLQGILLRHVMYTNALNWKTLQIRRCTWKFKHQQYIHQSTNQHTLRILTSLNSSSSFRCSIASFSALFLCSFSTFSYFFQYSSIWRKSEDKNFTAFSILL